MADIVNAAHPPATIDFKDVAFTCVSAVFAIELNTYVCVTLISTLPQIRFRQGGLPQPVVSHSSWGQSGVCRPFRLRVRVAIVTSSSFALTSVVLIHISLQSNFKSSLKSNTIILLQQVHHCADADAVLRLQGRLHQRGWTGVPNVIFISS